MLRAWDTLDSRYLIRDRWLTLRVDRCETDCGVIVDPYYVQEPRDWVQVVAFDSSDHILVTRQYRHGLGEICTELPGGGVDDGETPSEAIRRELLEETGHTTDEFHALPPMSPNPAIYSNRIHSFVARGAKQIRTPTQDATENIEFSFVTVPQLLSLIDAGRFAHALHVSTVLLALNKLGMLMLRGL
jgi:8-oxo-dGTP pyrophosphatase MutT (NUDIX family)